MRLVPALVPLLLGVLQATAPAQSPPYAPDYVGGGRTPLNDFAAERDVDVDASGVLRRVGLLCTAFETDFGELFVLSDRGSFELGDRVHVRGRTVGTIICGSLLVTRLDNTIEPAFAGSGTIVPDRALGLALRTPEGARYKLLDPFGFALGEDVFVRGVVRKCTHPVTDKDEHWIFPHSVGAAFAGYGRLVGGFGAWTVELEDATLLALDAPGYAFASAGDYVFVEGALDLSTSPPTLAHNTSRRAFAAPGEIVDVGGTPGFRAETIVFDDLFSLEDLGSLTVGDRAYVRGRRLDDYDPLEVRGNLIRGSRIRPEFSGCGTIVADLGTGLSFQASAGGPTFELETLGPYGAEPFVFVAGAVDPTGTRFEHNLISPCLELQGTLQLGFECTPLFVADSAPPGAGLLLLENLGPYWIGDSLCVQGGIMACDVGCPVPCLMANDVSDCTR